MARWTPLPFLFCVLLLHAQGGPRNRHHFLPKPMEPVEIKICEKQTNIYLCQRLCTHHRDCQANSICCTSFCGNVCMSLL
ncbi:WAP four-disulfide core domain protein 10A-like [Rhynchocyon petersi]